jgi:hypothetical protein
MTAFSPRLDILPAPQQRLWGELIEVPPSFTLYGGTAIALYLGHRESIDFDFFGNEHFDPVRLRQRIPFLHDADTLLLDVNDLTCVVDRGGLVQVSFFGVPEIGLVEAPTVVDSIGLKIASLVDLAGMKAAVVQKRAQVKDYIDIDALITSGLDLSTALAAGMIIYGRGFNPQITLKALTYFEDGDVKTLPQATRRRLLDAVQAVDLDRLPSLTAMKVRPEARGHKL